MCAAKHESGKAIFMTMHGVVGVPGRGNGPTCHVAHSRTALNNDKA